MFILLFITNAVPFLSANDFESDFNAFLENTGLIKNNKELVTFYFRKETKEKYTKSTLDSIDTTLFPDEKSITYKDLQQAFKDCKNIFLFSSDEYLKFTWKEGRKFNVSTIYAQSIHRMIYASGVYVFRVFDDNMVYTIRILDCTNIIDRSLEYDKLDNLLVFKEGMRTDPIKGIEGNQRLNQMAIIAPFDLS